MKSKRLKSIGRQMPALAHHKDKTKPFDPAKSEVLKWISKQPEFLIWIMQHLMDDGAIQYNTNAGRWSGVEIQ